MAFPAVQVVEGPRNLRFLSAAILSRTIPALRGLGRLGLLLLRLGMRSAPELVAVRNRGAWILAEPRVGVFDQVVVFLPQFDNRAELDFVLENLRIGDEFVDLGANIGKFTLPAARRVGQQGRVLAIEPEPANARLLLEAVRMNEFHHVHVRQVAIDVRGGVAALHLNASGNRGAHSLVSGSPARVTIEVPVVRLADLLATAPAVLKTDIEGLDEAVLLDHLESGGAAPRCILAEQKASGADTDFVTRMSRFGYRVIDVRERNIMMERAPHPL